MEMKYLFCLNDINNAAALLITFTKVTFAHAVIGCPITSRFITMGSTTLFFSTFAGVFVVLQTSFIIVFRFFVAFVKIHVCIP